MQGMIGVADVSGRSIAELVSLAGRSAVVTGAAQGLGRAIAARLAEAGADVLVADLNADLAATVATELDAQSAGKVRACALDASDAASVAAAAAKAVEDFGAIGIWVNNAGIFQIGRASCRERV